VASPAACHGGGDAVLASAATLYAASNGRDAFAEVPAGTRLEVDAEKNFLFKGTNWVAAAVPRHLSVWVHGEFAPGGKVAQNNIHVRAGAGTHFKSLGMAPKGAELEVRGALGEWLRVAPPGSARIWVDGALLKPAPEPETETPVQTLVASEGDLPRETPEMGRAVENKIEIPAELAGVLLSQTQPQGRVTEVTGVADWPFAQHWNLPANAVVQTPGGEMFLLYTPESANGFVGAKITARGTLWWLAGQDVPLLLAEVLDAHPFSLEGDGSILLPSAPREQDAPATLRREP